MVVLQTRSYVQKATSCFVTALNPSFDWKTNLLAYQRKILKHLPSRLRSPFNLVCAYVGIHIGILLALLHPLVKEMRQGLSSVRSNFKNPLATVLTAIFMVLAKLKKEVLLFLPIAAIAHFFFKMSVFDIFKWTSFRVQPQLQIKPQLTLITKSRSDPTISLSAESLDSKGLETKKKSKSSVNLSAESMELDCSCSVGVPVVNAMVQKLERDVKNTAEALKITCDLADTLYEEEPSSLLLQSAAEVQKSDQTFFSASEGSENASETSL
uniref:CRAL-TRIO domain-containing protein n=1 Tax=Steinernema glaseri TaxID=37863 RepID=A0A1I8ARG9_9BILA